MEQGIFTVPKNRDDENYLAHQESSLVYWSRLLSAPTCPGGRASLFVVELNASNVDGPAVAVPFNLDYKTEMEWMVVPASFEWHSIFQNDMAFFLQQDKELGKAETKAVAMKDEAKKLVRKRKAGHAKREPKVQKLHYK